MFVSQLTQSLDVTTLESRISRRLDPQHTSVRLDILLHSFHSLGQINEVSCDPMMSQSHFSGIPSSSTVDVITEQSMVTCLEHHQH